MKRKYYYIPKDYKNQMIIASEQEKIISKYHLNCYLDSEKNFSNLSCYCLHSAYSFTNIFDISKVEKIPIEGIGFLYSKHIAYKLLTQYKNRNIPYIYMDNSYFSRMDSSRKSKFRIIVNNIHPQKDIDTKIDSDISLLPWKERKSKRSYILLCPPSNNPNNNILRLFGVSRDWVYNTITTIRQQTTRRIFVRFKNYDSDYLDHELESFFIKLNKRFGNIEYAASISQVKLTDLFENCYAVVAPASGASVIAAINGVPVFSESFGPVGSIAVHDYSQINSPIYPDREAWFNRIMGHEFSIEELYNGQCLNRIKSIYPVELEGILNEKINFLQQ